MGIVTKTVGSALAGRDYTSVQSAVDSGVPANLVNDGNSYEVVIYPEGAGANGEYSQSGAFLNITNGSHVTSSTYTLTIKAASGHAWFEHADAAVNRIAYDSSKGVALKFTGSYSVGITVSIPNVIIDGIQLKAAASPAQGILFNSTSTNCTVSRCIIQSRPGTTGNGVGLLGAGGHKLVNSVVILDTAEAAASAVALSYGSVCVNNTIVRPSQYPAAGKAFNIGYSANTVRNCAVFGFAVAAGLGSGGSYNSDGHNCTDFTSVPGSVSNLTSLNYADQFVNNNNNLGVEDYRLKSSSQCVNAGVSATAFIPTDTDALGTARPEGAAWDVGAIEYKVVTATAVTMTGPSTGSTGQASSNFTVGGNYDIVTDIVVTPDDNSGGGTFTPTSVTLTTGSPTGTFTYTAASNGAKTISATNDSGLTNPANITFTSSTPAIAPTASITSIVVDGQSVTVNLNTANTPVSGLATITATGGEAVSQGPIAVTIGSGTATVTFTGLLSGTYAIPTVTVTNTGGTNAATGGSIVTILGISGQPESGASENAATITLSAPRLGFVAVATTAITIAAPSGAISGDVIITPSDGGDGGTFTPSTITVNSGSRSGTMTYTAASSGSKTLSFTNNGGLTNPSNVTCFINSGHTRKKTKGMRRYAGLFLV